ncbi:MAG: class D sortase [Ardenticatenaceae bacterium]|nr:class D sortase [Ardenticatenaceae bacterium]
MRRKESLDELSVEELQQALYRKKREARQERLQRLKRNGRLIEIANLPAPSPDPPPIIRPTFAPHPTTTTEEAATPRLKWRWVANKFLLFIELTAIVGFLTVLFGLWNTGQELNQELAQIQQEQVASIALPTPTATPIIDVVVLPSGHKPPVDGRPPEQGEAGDIPEHLLPAINAYIPPPVPTPGPQQARRLQIPAIDVDNVIVQGDDWEQLKKGVGQHIGSPLPGQHGNLILSAHNDIFGEIFRYLDKLSPGDEIIISTDLTTFTYVVRDIAIVDPTDVWVMNPTEHASATLISCYPYRVNDKRIIIFADLATSSINS